LDEITGFETRLVAETNERTRGVLMGTVVVGGRPAEKLGSAVLGYYRGSSLDRRCRPWPKDARLAGGFAANTRRPIL